MDHFLLARGYTVSQTPSNLPGWEWKMPKKGLAQMKSLPNLLPSVPFQSVYHGSAQIYTLENQRYTLDNHPSTLFLVCVSANVLSKAECVELMHACTKLKHSIFLSTFALPIAVGKKFPLERLLLHEVLIPKLLNGDVPHYKLLTEQEIQQVEKHECTKRSKFPHMNYETDAIARYCGFLPGTVVFNKEKQEYRLVD